MDATEQLRQQFKPHRVRVLFVGESPPAGGTFFYNADSNLYRATQEAFSRVFGSECGVGEAFLNFFRDKGCYLVDLSSEPMNRLPRAERKRKREDNVPRLADELSHYQPEALIVVMMGIARHVRRAVNAADLVSVPIRSLPFPGWDNNNRDRYVGKLAEILRDVYTTLGGE